MANISKTDIEACATKFGINNNSVFAAGLKRNFDEALEALPKDLTGAARHQAAWDKVSDKIATAAAAREKTVDTANVVSNDVVDTVKNTFVKPDGSLKDNVSGIDVSGGFNAVLRQPIGAGWNDTRGKPKGATLAAFTSNESAIRGYWGFFQENLNAIEQGMKFTDNIKRLTNWSFDRTVDGRPGGEVFVDVLNGKVKTKDEGINKAVEHWRMLLKQQRDYFADVTGNRREAMEKLYEDNSLPFLTDTKRMADIGKDEWVDLLLKAEVNRTKIELEDMFDQIMRGANSARGFKNDSLPVLVFKNAKGYAEYLKKATKATGTYDAVFITINDVTRVLAEKKTVGSFDLFKGKANRMMNDLGITDGSTSKFLRPFMTRGHFNTLIQDATGELSKTAQYIPNVTAVDLDINEYQLSQASNSIELAPGDKVRLLRDFEDLGLELYGRPGLYKELTDGDVRVIIDSARKVLGLELTKQHVHSMFVDGGTVAGVKVKKLSETNTLTHFGNQEIHKIVEGDKETIMAAVRKGRESPEYQRLGDDEISKKIFDEKTAIRAVEKLLSEKHSVRFSNWMMRNFAGIRSALSVAKLGLVVLDFPAEGVFFQQFLQQINPDGDTQFGKSLTGLLKGGLNRQEVKEQLAIFGGMNVDLQKRLQSMARDIDEGADINHVIHKFNNFFLESTGFAGAVSASSSTRQLMFSNTVIQLLKKGNWSKQLESSKDIMTQLGVGEKHFNKLHDDYIKGGKVKHSNSFFGTDYELINFMEIADEDAKLAWIGAMNTADRIGGGEKDADVRALIARGGFGDSSLGQRGTILREFAETAGVFKTWGIVTFHRMFLPYMMYLKKNWNNPDATDIKTKTAMLGAMLTTAAFFTSYMRAFMNGDVEDIFNPTQDEFLAAAAGAVGRSGVGGIWNSLLWNKYSGKSFPHTILDEPVSGTFIKGGKAAIDAASLLTYPFRDDEGKEGLLEGAGKSAGKFASDLAGNGSHILWKAASRWRADAEVLAEVERNRRTFY